MDVNEKENCIKSTRSQYFPNPSDINFFPQSSSIKPVKTFPKDYQLSKLSTTKKETNTSDSTPIDNLQERQEFQRANTLDFITEYNECENALEDEHQTEEWFLKITIDELVAFLFSLLGIGNALIYYEVRTCTKDCNGNDPQMQLDAENMTLIISSIASLFFFLTMFFKYYHYFKLHQCGKYIQTGDKFFKTSLWTNVLTEFILLFFHPNLIFKDWYCTTGRWNLVEVRFNVNDFFIVITLIRILDWVRIVAMQTDFYCARADRICKMMGIQLSPMFSIKCLLIHNTMEMQFFITLIIILGLGYILKVIEGSVFDITAPYPHTNNFTDLGSCIWYIFVTITTVGYGDYSTETTLGRIVTLIIGLIGTVLLAFNINYFQSQTQMDDGEIRALELIQRLEAKKNMRKVAAQYFKSNVKYFVNKNKYLRGEIPMDVETKKNLLKFAKKKNKLRKDYHSVLHQFEIAYKTTSDVDLIKKKIQDLETYFEKSTEKIEKIEKALEMLLQ